MIGLFSCGQRIAASFFFLKHCRKHWKSEKLTDRYFFEEVGSGNLIGISRGKAFHVNRTKLDFSKQVGPNLGLHPNRIS